MSNVVIRVDPENRQWWKKTLQSGLPESKVYLWDEDEFDQEEIDYAVVWMPPLGAMQSLPNLKAVFSVGAGVTHILRDKSYPRSVPIVRTVNSDLRKRMTEYVVLHVLRFHRRLPDIEQANVDRTWKQYVQPLARDVTVGILGLGNLGAAAARALSFLGYNLVGWSRRGKPVEGVQVFSGADGLATVLRQSQIVVCMLPGTSETENLLNQSNLQLMPEGSYLINVGRGETIVDDDLVGCLQQGHLHGATLDVFRSEPLSPDNPYWQIPRVLVTCHTASAIEPATGGRTIIDNILTVDSGDIPADVVDMDQGY